MEPGYLGVVAAMVLTVVMLARPGQRRRAAQRDQRPPARPRRRTPSMRPATRRRYPGDYPGRVNAIYAPHPDGRPDPGEVVWTWVPYEDDPTQGKDRPVLIVGRDRAWLLALMMTSQDHDIDAADEARWGRRWMDVGSGAWDHQGRPSEVRLDRIIRVHPDDIRREGAVLDESRFQSVARALKGLAP